MKYPGPGAYQEALQHPSSAFLDSELARGEPRLNAMGLPQPITGAFAAVFPVDTVAGSYAARCFLTEVKDQHQRYRAVSRYLDAKSISAFVQYEYQKRGIRVGGGVFPLLKMKWADGRPLNQFVQEHLDKPGMLEALSRVWLRLLADLHKAGLAHGDLQHGNVLVAGGGGVEPRMFLVDYDTMFVPALRGKRSPELGHRNFQHPDRSATYFDDTIDHFSGIAIYVSLRALVHRPELWLEHDTGENLLFQADDFYRPSQSALFSSLRAIDEITPLVGVLEASCYSPPDRTPFLIDVLQGKAERPRPVKGWRRLRVRDRGAVRSPLEMVIPLASAASIIVSGLVFGLSPLAGLIGFGLSLGLTAGLAMIGFSNNESRKRIVRLEAELRQTLRLAHELDREFEALERERSRFVGKKEQLKAQRLAELREGILKDRLKYHFIGELESVDGVAHRVVVRLKKAGIRTAYHISPERLSRVTGIGEESRALVLAWHAALVARCDRDMPDELSEAELQRLNRHVESRLEQMDIETARLREKISVQHAEAIRITVRRDETPSVTFGSYLGFLFGIGELPRDRNERGRRDGTAGRTPPSGGSASEGLVEAGVLPVTDQSGS